MSFLLLEFLVGTIVARRAIVVLAVLLSMSPPVVPSPSIAGLAVLIVIDVAKSP
jgi:hypothetical protein